MDNKRLKEAYAFLSKCILNTLKTEDFNNETLLSFCVYLIFGVIKARVGDLKNVDPFISHFLDQNLNQFSSAPFDTGDVMEFAEIFQNNKELLQQIQTDVWVCLSKEDFAWLRDWVDFCSRAIHSSSDLDIETAMLLSVVDDHFEFYGPFSLIFLYCINRNYDLKT